MSVDIRFFIITAVAERDMIIDQAVIIVRSGKGGDGAVSFRRQKYIPKGGPDGGDGGDGGSVIFLADPEVETLLDFAGRHHWYADNGGPGGPAQRHGKNGQDLFVKIPPGTLVYNDETGELIVDMDQPGLTFTIARGGRGGFGNEHFKSATHQTPRESTAGESGVELQLRLELKLIADIGLVGAPNAGKSTLLSRISQATPKIADYPFTTLKPQLGIVLLPGDRRMVVADIPGLIAGAHAGHGLGTRFLRHIERTQLLVHLIEVMPVDGSDPIDHYQIVRDELTRFTPDLADKPEVVVLSKIDLVDQEQSMAIAKRIEQSLGRSVVPISAASGKGLDALQEVCWKHLRMLPRREKGWDAGRDEV